MTVEEIIKGLQATNEHIGKHFNEGGAWMAEFIDNAIKALEDVEKEVRKRFGFAERENVVDYSFIIPSSRSQNGADMRGEQDE